LTLCLIYKSQTGKSSAKRLIVDNFRGPISNFAILGHE